MLLKITGSGSSGNNYILESESEILLIEAGISLKKVKQAINFNINKVVGMIFSHAHL